jgi:hypothetical protein
MEKFLKNDLTGPQEVSLEVLTTLFPAFASSPEEVQKKSNKFVLVHEGKTEDGLVWQVAYQDIPHQQNWFYHIFIFGLDGKLTATLASRAVHPFPPVFEKKYGVDYLDWCDVQGNLSKWLTDNKFKPLEFDLSTEGKVVYLTKESPAEIVEILKSGKNYSIVAIPADEYMQKAKDWADARKAEQKLIVTPDEVNARKASTIITP